MGERDIVDCGNGFEEVQARGQLLRDAQAALLRHDSLERSLAIAEAGVEKYRVLASSNTQEQFVVLRQRSQEIYDAGKVLSQYERVATQGKAASTAMKQAKADIQECLDTIESLKTQMRAEGLWCVVCDRPMAADDKNGVQHACEEA